MASQEEIAETIVKRWDRAISDRASWEGHWQECAEYVAPRKAGIFAMLTRGGKRMSKVFDCTAIEANDIFAAGLYGHLCPPNQRWFALKPPHPERDAASKEWYHEATRILHEELAISNFGMAIHGDFKDLGWCGTGCISCEEGTPGDPALHFDTLHISNYVAFESSRGKIDTIYRRIRFTPRQAIQAFGEQKVTEEIREAANDEKKRDIPFEFIHAVFPREERDARKRDKLNMPFASIYVAKKDKKIVSEGGNMGLPLIVHRLDCEDPGEIYGRSPTMKMIAEIKVLNRMVRTTEMAAEKRADPPLNVPTNYPYTIRTGPGGINYYKAGTSDRIESLNLSGDIVITLEMKEMRRQRINRAFFVDLFLLLDQLQEQQKTATEIVERVEEKLLILGPLLGRLQSELFNPLIDRALGVLLRAGKLPPVPEGLAFYEIEYISKLALAMRLMEVNAMTSTIQRLEPFIAMNPAVMDNFDDDKITRGIYERMGGPVDWLRDPDTRDSIREMRAQREEAAQALAASEQVAEIAQKGSKKIEEGSPLAELMKET